MKRNLMFSLSAAAMFAGTAHAAPLSSLDWIDPNGMELWQGMSVADKNESVRTMLIHNEGSNASDTPILQGKILACIDREVSDPDYLGLSIPLLIPQTGCMTKYLSILDAKRQGKEL